MKICQICYKEEILHKHHITSKCFNGSNKTFNIAYLCPSCHNKVHKSLIVLEGIFLTSEGYELIWHNKGEESITDSVLPKVFVY